MKTRKDATRNATTSLPGALYVELKRIGGQRRWSLSQVMRVALEEFVRRNRDGKAA